MKRRICFLRRRTRAFWGLGGCWRWGRFGIGVLVPLRWMVEVATDGPGEYRHGLFNGGAWPHRGVVGECEV